MKIMMLMLLLMTTPIGGAADELTLGRTLSEHILNLTCFGRGCKLKL